MNGTDTTALPGSAAAVTAGPEPGEARFAVSTCRQRGSRSRAHLTPCHLGGQQHPRQLATDAGEPPGLPGGDTTSPAAGADPNAAITDADR